MAAVISGMIFWLCDGTQVELRNVRLVAPTGPSDRALIFAALGEFRSGDPVFRHQQNHHLTTAWFSLHLNAHLYLLHSLRN